MVVEIQLSMFNLSIGGSFFLLFFLPLSMCYCGLATVLHIGAKLFGLLIFTLISENQGLEKLRSVSNLRKISSPANLDFFQVYGINLVFFLGGDLENNTGLQDLKFF